MNNNTPPFHVGQKVVALATSNKRQGLQFIKGSIYTVHKCYKCTCGKWIVTVTELIWSGIGVFKLCCIDPPDTYCGGESKYFAPIISQYADIRAEIAAGCKETIEAPDKVIIREPVNN